MPKAGEDEATPMDTDDQKKNTKAAAADDDDDIVIDDGEEMTDEDRVLKENLELMVERAADSDRDVQVCFVILLHPIY